jgi:hypothetical protein
MAGEGQKAEPRAATARKPRRPPRPRHVPQRTCVGCGQERPKRELVRVVRTPDGHVVVDPTGKKSGRGAYLCARRSCWDPGLNKGRLEHVLKTTISPEDRAGLDAYVATLPAEPEPAAARAGTRRPKASSRTASAKKAGEGSGASGA